MAPPHINARKMAPNVYFGFLQYENFAAIIIGIEINIYCKCVYYFKIICYQVILPLLKKLLQLMHQQPLHRALILKCQQKVFTRWATRWHAPDGTNKGKLWYLTHGCEKTLRIEESRHPKTNGPSLVQPFYKLVVPFHKFRKPESQSTRFPGNLFKIHCFLNYCYYCRHPNYTTRPQHCSLKIHHAPCYCNQK